MAPPKPPPKVKPPLPTYELLALGVRRTWHAPLPPRFLRECFRSAVLGTIGRLRRTNPRVCPKVCPCWGDSKGRGVSPVIENTVLNIAQCPVVTSGLRYVVRASSSPCGPCRFSFRRICLARRRPGSSSRVPCIYAEAVQHLVKSYLRLSSGPGRGHPEIRGGQHGPRATCRPAIMCLHGLFRAAQIDGGLLDGEQPCLDGGATSSRQVGRAVSPPPARRIRR